MSADTRYALLPANPHRLPQVFRDLDHLARHIQRARGLRALELAEVEDLEIAGDTAPRPGVSVFASDDHGGRETLIGHAYLAGRGLEHLQAALRRNRLVVTGEAA